MNTSILFVCLGNICRSPMAEAIFREKLKERRLTKQFQVDSAGTSDFNVGLPPHKGTIKKLAQHRISTEGMTARQLTAIDASRFDYIVCMDAQNVKDTLRILPKDHETEVFRLLDLTKNPQDVPDPYYTGDFDETYKLCVAGCNALLDELTK